MPVPKSKSAAKKSASKVVSEPKVKKESVLCHCGCGEMAKPGRMFIQGHDSRFKGRVTKVADGRMEWSDVEAQIEAYAVKGYKESITEAKKTVKPFVAKVKAKVAAKAKPKLKAKAKVKAKVAAKANPDADVPSDQSGE